MSKRERQQQEAVAWTEIRGAEISRATNFLFRRGEPQPGSGLARVLFVIGMQREAGITTFLDRIQPKGERRIRVSCDDDDSRDPLFEALVAALWHLVVTRAGADERYCDALFTHVGKGCSLEDLRRMVRVAGADAPHRFRIDLPHDFLTLWKILTYVDGTDVERWRLFVDCAFVMARHRTLKGVMSFRKKANLEIAIGVRWTTEAVQMIEDWRREKKAEMLVVKLEPQRHGTRVRSDEPNPLRVLLFPMVREGGTAREAWNGQAIDLIVKTTAALDGIEQEDLEHLGSLFHAQSDALQKLLADYDTLHATDDGYRASPAWRDAVSSEDLVRLVEEALVSGASNPAAEWLVKVARRNARRDHDDPLASARSVLLAIAAYYVHASRTRDQAGAATSATLLARYLEEHTSEASDRHFAILADLHRDSDHLSIIDYGLTLMARRSGEPSFEEMRFFRSACRAARRYADQQVSLEAAKQASGERLRSWIVPYELALLTNALHSVWPGRALKAWLDPFADRFREFGLTPTAARLRQQEDRLGSKRSRGEWGRPERATAQARRLLLKGAGKS